MFGSLETKKIVKKHKRVGRGGKRGKSAGRGRGGQLSRPGGSSEIKPFFEGGQMSLFRRIPRRGFTNIHAEEYQIVALRDVERIAQAGDKVDFEYLKNCGLVKRSIKNNVKILATGSVTKSINFVVKAVSKKAKEMIEQAGGTVSLV